MEILNKAMGFFIRGYVCIRNALIQELLINFTEKEVIEIIRNENQVKDFSFIVATLEVFLFMAFHKSNYI